MSPLIKLIELLLMTARTAMTVADDTGTLSAAPGFRVISAGLAIGPSISVVIPAKMRPVTCRASSLRFVREMGEIVRLTEIRRRFSCSLPPNVSRRDHRDAPRG